MGKNIVNVALFGLGRIGQMHAENLLSHPRFNLIYVYDLNKKLSKKMSNKFKCANLRNPDIAMKDKKVDVIFIATSTSTHLKFITNAVKNKKVVFCEKPLDLDINKLKKMSIIEIDGKKYIPFPFQDNVIYIPSEKYADFLDLDYSFHYTGLDNLESQLNQSVN